MSNEYFRGNNLIEKWKDIYWKQVRKYLSTK